MHQHPKQQIPRSRRRLSFRRERHIEPGHKPPAANGEGFELQTAHDRRLRDDASEVIRVNLRNERLRFWLRRRIGGRRRWNDGSSVLHDDLRGGRPGDAGGLFKVNSPRLIGFVLPG